MNNNQLTKSFGGVFNIGVEWRCKRPAPTSGYNATKIIGEKHESKI